MGSITRASVLVLIVAAQSACTSPPYPIDEVVRFCVLANSCGGPFGADAIDDCVRTNELQGATFGVELRAVIGQRVSCAATSDCGRFHTCLRLGRDDSYCAVHPNASCDGNVAVNCSPANARECDPRFEACAIVNGFATCSATIGCNGGTRSFCMGNRLVDCGSVPMSVTSNDCADVVAGGICIAIPTGAACVPPERCEVEGSEYCEGDVLVTCHHGHAFKTDCRRGIEGHCVVDSGSAFCRPDAADCTSLDEHCDGAMLVSCVNGRVRPFDCTTIGFRQCVRIGDGMLGCFP